MGTLYALAFNGTKNLIPVIITVSIINFSLLIFHFTEQNHFLFFRKVFCHLFFCAAKNKRIKDLFQMIFPVFFSKLINGNREFLAEEFHSSEQTWIQKIHLGKNVKSVVLKRRTTHAKAMLCI